MRRGVVRARTAPRITEAQIQKAIVDFLALDGWRCIVTDPPWMRGLGVTERGIPDNLFIRYCCGPNALLTDVDDIRRADAQVLWLEAKRKGGKAGEHQKAWHARERARGALVWCAGEDFEATIEAFRAHYIKSGLARKVTR